MESITRRSARAVADDAADAIAAAAAADDANASHLPYLSSGVNDNLRFVVVTGTNASRLIAFFVEYKQK